MSYFPKHLAQEQNLCVVVCASVRQAIYLQHTLNLFVPQRNIVYFPHWETLPYDHFSPHQDLISERLSGLYALQAGQFDVWITTPNTWMMRLCPPGHLLRYVFLLKKGDELELQVLREQLVRASYLHVGQVLSPGEFSLRGGTIDVFPPGATLPYRIECLDAQVETIRHFDPNTQRSTQLLDEIRLLPAREYPTDQEHIDLFRKHYRTYFDDGDLTQHVIYQSVSRGVFPAGIEYFFPLFFEKTASLADFIPEGTKVYAQGNLDAAFKGMWEHIQQRYLDASRFPERPVLDPKTLYLSSEEAKHLCHIIPVSEDISIHPIPDLVMDHQLRDPFCKLRHHLQNPKQKTLLLAESLGRQEVLRQTLQDHQLNTGITPSWKDFLQKPPGLYMTVGQCGQSFWHDQETLVLDAQDLYSPQKSESQAYPQRGRRRQRSIHQHSASVDWAVRELAEIQEGDYVVHEEHGIGKYLGLVMMYPGEDYETEMLHIAYQNQASLYVPITQLHLISRYGSQGERRVNLDQLGSQRWQKIRQKAAEQARDTAAELLGLYAKRSLRTREPYGVDEIEYQRFSSGFGFEETPDQEAAITTVLKDMYGPIPMDRLVCGDVGFGKTEVALRAVFVAVMSAKQVVVLVPTTLLAEQHYQNFSQRFATWPVNIAELSRFRSKKEQTKILAGLEDGSIDIVIGTHRLIQDDVHFQSLGLVVIDEEHRFGVRQKEKLKQMRAYVDILALTATPIPRTLSFALEGLRDFSVITTPPQRRLPVRTFVTQDHRSVVSEAIRRELQRGGQVYFLYNEVERIHTMYRNLQELIPEAQIGVAHGQMKERQLEQIMHDFTAQRYQILLCSTIIETGIDVPNANTILIYRADRFGLAQLHQLRGRVGRSHHQAYAYLLVPEQVGNEAEKRLEAIRHLDALGAGFNLALEDMEIRGAGEILGESQSGNIQAVGFSLYHDMLHQAIRSIKNQEPLDSDFSPARQLDVNIHQPALLPPSYCPDTHERLLIYKQLTAAQQEEELDRIHENLIDRFGLPGETVHALLATHRIRLWAQDFSFEKIEISDSHLVISFGKKTSHIDPLGLIQTVQKYQGSRLMGKEKVKFACPSQNLEQKLFHVKEILSRIRDVKA